MTTPAGDPRRTPLLELILAAGSLLGLVLTVIGLDIDRTARAVGAVLLVLAAACGIGGIVVAQRRRLAIGASIALVLGAVGMLALAPPGGSAVAPGRPSTATPGLIVSSMEVLAAGPNRPATIDVSLRNPGGIRVGLTGAEVTILDFALIPVCVSAANTQVSAEYDLQLPDEPAPGTVLRRVLHQEIGPDALDRFTLRFKAPNAGPKANELDSYVYRVRITVAQDGGLPPVDLGEFVVEGQNAVTGTDHYFPSRTPATLADARDHGLCQDDKACQEATRACWNANRAALERLLGDGARLSDGAHQARQTLFG